MSLEHAHDVRKEVKRYLIVFAALLVGTIVTVLVNELNFRKIQIAIAIALFIASIKAFLVAGYFMHLMSERKMIYGILTATIFFVAGLMYLTVWSMQPDSIVHIRHVP